MRIRATSFADPADLRAYNRAVISGESPRAALAKGDNGIGASELSTVAGTGPCVALYGHANLGRRVKLIHGDKTVEADVRDVAPTGVCDLNPDACAELGLVPPVDTTIEMFFVE
jgi:hypothetical protein